MEKANRLVLCCILILPLVFAGADSLAASVPGLQLSPKWTYGPGGGNLAVADNYVYFLTSNQYSSGTLVSVNASTGSYVWTSPSEARAGVFNAAPAFRDGYVYTSTEAFNATTGELFLNYSSYSGYGSPRVANGVLLLTTSDPTNGFAPDSLLALNYKTGNKIWGFNEGKNLVGGNGHMIGFQNRPPTIVNGIAYFCCASGVYAFNIQTGGQLWRFPLIAFGDSVVANSKVVLIAHRDSYVDASNITLFCLDASTGQSKWTYPIAKVDEPTVGEDIVYIEGNALSISTGKALWSNINLEKTSISEGVVYSGSGSSVFAFNESTGEMIANYTFSDSVTVTSIIAAKSLVFAKTDSEYSEKTGNGYELRVNSQVSALMLTSPTPSVQPSLTEGDLNYNVEVALVVAASCIILAAAIILYQKSSRSKSVKRRQCTH